jgi:hypothetical protein
VVELAQIRSRLWQKWDRKGAGCGRNGTEKEQAVVEMAQKRSRQ